MMETSGRKSWSLKFFPAICFIPQELPEMRGVTDTTRPSASYHIISVVCPSTIVSALLTHAHDGHRFMLVTLDRSHGD